MADPLIASSRPSADGGWSNAYSSLPASVSSRGAMSPPPTDSYVRDPKIFGMPSPSLVAPSSAGGGVGEKPFIKIRIGGMERNRKDLLVRFDASTNLPNFRTTLYRNMQRSYVEFQLFAEQMAYGNPQAIVPALPLPSTSAVTDEEDDRLVRVALQRWLTRVCEDPILQKDEELRSFLESDFGYQPTPRPASATSTSFSHGLAYTLSRPTTSRVGAALPSAFTRVFKRGPPDEDEDLAAAKGELEKLEGGWGGAAAAVGRVGMARRSLAAAQAETGARMISLATAESGVDLGNAMRKVGRGMEALAGVAQAQAVSDNIVLSDTLGYQALNARAAKETLLNRIQVLEDAQNASKAAINKRRTVERLKGSSNISAQKVDDALAEMQDAQELDALLAQRVQAISTHLRAALQRHSQQAHEDVAAVLLEFARTKIMYERQTLKELEVLRPDLRGVGKAAAGKSVVGVGATNGAGTNARNGTSAYGSEPLGGAGQMPPVHQAPPPVAAPAVAPQAPPSQSGPPLAPQRVQVPPAPQGMSQSMFVSPAQQQPAYPAGASGMQPGPSAFGAGPPLIPGATGQRQQPGMPPLGPGAAYGGPPASAPQQPYVPSSQSYTSPASTSSPYPYPQQQGPPGSYPYQQQQPQAHPGAPHPGMVQSMFLPGQPPQQGGYPGQPYGAQSQLGRRKLDDRAAARSLANMF